MLFGEEVGELFKAIRKSEGLRTDKKIARGYKKRSLINSMSKIKLKIKGPFNLVGDNSLFDALENSLSGLYIFTIKLKDKYLIEYVGITARDFRTRLLEHLRELLSGGYQLYDLQKLENNEPFVVWKGRYSKDVDDNTAFLDNYSYFSQIIKRQLRELRIFLIPLKTEKRVLERIEGGIYKMLREQNNEQTMVFIKGVKSNPRRRNEKPITVTVAPNSLLSELPSNLEI